MISAHGIENKMIVTARIIKNKKLVTGIEAQRMCFVAFIHQRAE